MGSLSRQCQTPRLLGCTWNRAEELGSCKHPEPQLCTCTLAAVISALLSWKLPIQTPTSSAKPAAIRLTHGTALVLPLQSHVPRN